MTHATITEDLETLIHNTDRAIEYPETFLNIRPISNNYISVLYIFLPNFPKSKPLIKTLADYFRATDTIWYSPTLAGILLVGCGPKGAETIKERLNDKEKGLPQLFNMLIDKGIINELTEEQKIYRIKSKTYVSSDRTKEEFLSEVRSILVGKTDIYLNP